MKNSITLLLICAVILLSGCRIITREEEEAHEALKQKTADLAAGIFEAANAIESGIPPQFPLTAIKISASSIIQVSERNYPKAQAFMQQFKTVPTGAKQ